VVFGQDFDGQGRRVCTWPAPTRHSRSLLQTGTA
jgi:hypothetical protein